MWFYQRAFVMYEIIVNHSRVSVILESNILVLFVRARVDGSLVNIHVYKYTHAVRGLPELYYVFIR